jgi:cellulose synthase/poly-beta-1,6-N-acetylglucosamine synthase-like glycosyltransferase
MMGIEFFDHWSLAGGICLTAIALGYAGLIGFFTWGWYGGKRALRNDNININGRCGVSVVVAARDEEGNIAALLEDLMRQDYPGELTEIIVVDDHSGDQTVRSVKGFKEKNSEIRLILLKNEDFGGAGKKAAIHLGIRHAIGDIILITDADCRPGPKWISLMVRGFQDEMIKMIFGPVAYFSGKGFLDAFQSMEFAGLVASGAGAALAGRPFMCNGANLAYRKEAFLQVKGFEGNEGFISGDDVFLLHKMKKEFGRRAIIFCKDEDAIVKTFPAAGWKDFIRQRIRWASKSRGYKDPLSIFTAIIVFSFSLATLSSFIAGFFNPWFFLASGGLFLLKTITDFPIMLGITGFTRQRRLLRFYLPFQVVYPIYIVIAGLGSFFGRKKW